MADDRPFGLHGLIATTAGQWVFRGRRGVIDIDSKLPSPEPRASTVAVVTRCLETAS